MNTSRFSALALSLALVGGLAAAPARGAGREIRYTVKLNGNPAGSATTTIVSERERRYHFEYNDRGRGPKFDQRVVVDARNVPQLNAITGQDYWKATVDESFQREGGVATWSLGGKKTQSTSAAPLVYLSQSGDAQEMEALARALLAAEKNTLGLLPSGQASLARAATAEVEAAGQRQKVHLFAISGLSFGPVYIWLDERNDLFAQDQGWLDVVREGWEGALPKLTEAQLDVQKKRERELAGLARRPSGPLVIRNARLFDPESRQATPGMTVVISGNRIQAVGKHGEVQVPAGAEVIDAAGKTLLPGLWDMHVHLAASDGLLHLAAGVTTVRDLGNDPDQILDIRRRYDSGETLGPRVHLAGFIDGPGPFAGPTKVLVDTEEEALAAVDRYHSLGYDQVKLYNSLDPKLVPAIVARAHAKGLRVSGHIPSGMTAEEAVRAGFDEVQHANFLLLNFRKGVDTRTPARFSEVGEHAADLDFDSQPVRDFVALLKERQIEADPTLVGFEGMFTARRGEVPRAYTAVIDRLPPQTQRGLLARGAAPVGMEERYRLAYEAMKKMVRVLYENGVPVLAGTDTLAGFAMHRELELYVEAGIPAPETLRIATLVAARTMNRDKDLGTVAPGKLADVILVDGDPLARIGDIRKVVLTVKDGVVYDPAKLYQAVNVQPVR